MWEKPPAGVNGRGLFQWGGREGQGRNRGSGDSTIPVSRWSESVIAEGKSPLSRFFGVEMRPGAADRGSGASAIGGPRGQNVGIAEGWLPLRGLPRATSGKGAARSPIKGLRCGNSGSHLPLFPFCPRKQGDNGSHLPLSPFKGRATRPIFTVSGKMLPLFRPAYQLSSY